MEAGLTLESIDRIDWNVPWLADFQPIAVPLLRADNWLSGINAEAKARAICNDRGLPIRFVPQADLPAGTSYETYIGETGGVPTRNNLHDFFNALIWLAYPQTKKQLNALQAAEIIKSASVQAHLGARNALRGKLRDAATIFDENAAIFMSADKEVTSALRAHQWQELFVTRRAAFERSCSVRLFGHALMEKLTTPYKAITAHARIVTVEPDFFKLSAGEQRERIDELVGRQMTQGLATSDFTPLPVLGVPGWWAQQDNEYYADQSVFRLKRVFRNEGV